MDILTYAHKTQIHIYTQMAHTFTCIHFTCVIQVAHMHTHINVNLQMHEYKDIDALTHTIIYAHIHALTHMCAVFFYQLLFRDGGTIKHA